jgi:amino acid transporter
MGKDKEMPTLLGILHGKYDTPHYGIWILVAISAAFGAYGVLNVDNLTQITLASNTGTFLLYGLTNLICLWAFFHRPDASFLKHKLVPFVGFLANILMLGAIVWIGMSAGGNTAMDAVIAISVVIVWLVIGGAWFIHNTKKEGHPVTTGHLPQATGLEIDNS